MRNVCKQLLTVLTLVLVCGTYAQQDSTYWQISPRIGYDFPTYNNDTPFIDYNGGINAGISVDYYWKWFGIGADFDYIRNSPESTYPTEDLSDGLGVPITNFDLVEDNITRLFFGIGPNFQHQSKSGKFVSELNLRAGVASIRGGETLLTDLPVLNGLNYHAGYDQSAVFTGKAQLRFTYYLNDFIGLQAGGYYMRHFNVSESFNPTFGFSAAYQPFTTSPTAGNVLSSSGPMVRQEACQHDISSIGAFVGMTFKLGKKAKKVCNVCGEDHQPHCCANCGCDITVTARDKFSKEVLPNTNIVLTDTDGNILHTGITNAYGVAVFKDVAESNYIIKGKLFDVNLDEGAISRSDFDGCKKGGKSIQKEIIYSDLNFVLKGKVVECNRDKPLNGVDVILKNVNKPGQKNTLSDTEGAFIFYVKQTANFLLKGNKNGYFSNEVSLSTSDYDRNKSLFIDFEVCVNPCGEAIRLDNIIFNLDKWEILPAAYPDLDYVVTLMRDNPSIKVEMSSHTDSRGSNAYNQTLSQKRAQSTVDYLMSKGISRDRLIAIGAGETELLNACADGVNCDEESHTINRRTEFKVVCP